MILKIQKTIHLKSGEPSVLIFNINKTIYFEARDPSLMSLFKPDVAKIYIEVDICNLTLLTEEPDW